MIGAGAFWYSVMENWWYEMGATPFFLKTESTVITRALPQGLSSLMTLALRVCRSGVTLHVPSSQLSLCHPL